MSSKKIKFENYKNCLEATQLEKIKNYLEKNKINWGNLKKIHKQFMRNNKSILKIQQRFKSEESYKITLTWNNDEIMQSIDSVETYVYGTSKDLVSEKKMIQCNNTIK